MTDPQGRIQCQWCGQIVHEIVILQDPSGKHWDVCRDGGCGNRLGLKRGFFKTTGHKRSGWYGKLFPPQPVRYMGMPRPTREELQAYLDDLMKNWVVNPIMTDVGARVAFIGRNLRHD